MWFLDSIVSSFDDVRAQFLDAYQEVRGWQVPFSYLALPLYYLYFAFYQLTFYFGYFNDWVDYAVTELRDILSWSTIRSLIRSWLPNLEGMVDWFQHRWEWMIQALDDWWSATSPIVQGWISIATEGLDTLQAAWSDFWIVTFPQWTAKLEQVASDLDYAFTKFLDYSTILGYLIDWGILFAGQIVRLIDTAFTLREPFWSGWQDWRDKVIEFFTDPEDWLYKAIDRIIERFW